MILSSLGHRKGHVRGFTLIELLVVIAIIGILSSVVLASLNTARNKGADAAIKSNIDSARAQSEIFYDSNGNTYDGGTAATDLCNVAASATGGVKGIYPNVLAAIQGSQGSTGALVAENAVETSSTASCNSNATTWVAQAPLKTGGYWCVDSTGAAKPEAAVLAVSSTACL
jgi:prepilin-type N-terminal cleavage/methylation domain-containing protein